MPRRNKPKNFKKDQNDDFDVNRLLGIERSESWSDGDWVVRRVTGSAATKTYRCPGCDQEIKPATPHTVSYETGSLDERRHWHTACWTRERKKYKREDLND
jgi:hypothetical protein